MPIKMEIRGLEKVRAALGQFHDQIQPAIELAQNDMVENILAVRGMRNYPPASSANNPPGNNGNGYYIRGRGWMRKSSGGYTLAGSSERLGTKWYVKPNGFSTKVGNPVTYAPFIHGDNQVDWALRVGWRKLAEVAEDKISESVAIYERHIQAIIRRLGL